MREKRAFSLYCCTVLAAGPVVAAGAMDMHESDVSSAGVSGSASEDARDGSRFPFLPKSIRFAF